MHFSIYVNGPELSSIVIDPWLHLNKIESSVQKCEVVGVKCIYNEVIFLQIASSRFTGDITHCKLEVVFEFLLKYFYRVLYHETLSKTFESC